MDRNRIRPISVLSVAIVLVLSGCPLPFEFVPSETTGTVASSNDPANPSITAAPTLIVTETTNGVPIAVAADSSVNAVRDITVQLESQAPGASIFYTTDGSDPVPSQGTTERYTIGQPIQFTGPAEDLELKAIAIGPGMYPSLVPPAWNVVITYESVGTPVFTPTPGDYTTDQSVSISTPTAGATIYYTVVDGIDSAPIPVPGQAGTIEYTGPISVAGSGTARSFAAIAVREEMSNSAVVTALYTIGYDGTAATPVFSLADGFQGTAQSLEITTATPGASIYYTVTTDGSEPADPTIGNADQLYTGLITLEGNAGDTYRIKAIASGTAVLPSEIASASFSLLRSVIVDSLTDDGAGTTLREAIQQALSLNGLGFFPVVVTFAPDLSGTIVLNAPIEFSGGSIIINGHVTDPDRIILDGGASDRILYMQETQMTIRGLTIQNGLQQGLSAPQAPQNGSGGGGGGALGGALYLGGDFVIEDSIIRNNAVRGGNGAGARFEAGNFFADGGQGGGPFGGAGGFAGNFDDVNGNGTPGANGGYLSGGGGGGTDNDNPGVGGEGGFAAGGGGGGGRRSGGDGASGGSGGAFGGNGGRGDSSGTAGGGGGGALGGAIYLQWGSLTVRDTLFADNLAYGGAAGETLFGAYPAGGGQGQGGAVFVNEGANYTEQNVIHSNNDARSGSGSAAGMEPDVYYY